VARDPDIHQELVELHEKISRLKSNLAVYRSKKSELLKVLDKHGVDSIASAKELISKVQKEASLLESRRKAIVAKIEKRLVKMKSELDGLEGDHEED